MADSNFVPPSDPAQPVVNIQQATGPLPPSPPLQNYKVKNFMFGNWRQGSVISFAQANADGNLARHVAENTLEPTFDAINVDPNSNQTQDSAAANNFIQLRQTQQSLAGKELEFNALQDEHNRLAASKRQWDKKLVELTDENARLRHVAEEQDRMLKAAAAGDDERAKLKKLLDEANDKIGSLQGQLDIEKANHQQTTDALRVADAAAKKAEADLAALEELTKPTAAADGK